MSADPAKNREASRRWNRTHPDRRRQDSLWRKYGLSVAQYKQLAQMQGGVCGCCKKPSTKPLDVDHDHGCCPGIKSCGRCIRGLLCRACNISLAVIERPGFIDAAHAYLDAAPAMMQMAEWQALRPSLFGEDEVA